MPQGKRIQTPEAWQTGRASAVVPILKRKTTAEMRRLLPSWCQGANIARRNGHAVSGWARNESPDHWMFKTTAPRICAYHPLALMMFFSFVSICFSTNTIFSALAL